MEKTQEGRFTIDFGLTNKKAIITAGTTGIGYAIARVLGVAGAHVIITGRTSNKVDEAVATLHKETGSKNIEGIAADAGTAEGCKLITQKYPQIDILVNNIGIYPTVPFTEITDEHWTNIFEINVLSGIRLSRFYLPVMKAANWGRIIFIASESGFNIPEEMIHYGVTKTCQISIASGLSKLTKGTGVTVNTVLPGPTKTEGVANLLNQMAQRAGISVQEQEKLVFQTGARSSSLLGRFLTIDEVAYPVLYIASTLSGSTNGATIRSEGGILCHI